MSQTDSRVEEEPTKNVREVVSVSVIRVFSFPEVRYREKPFYSPGFYGRTSIFDVKLQREKIKYLSLKRQFFRLPDDGRSFVGLSDLCTKKQY